MPSADAASRLRGPRLACGIGSADASSPGVATGNVVFSTIGFMELYLLVGVLFLWLVLGAIARGPEDAGEH